MGTSCAPWLSAVRPLSWSQWPACSFVAAATAATAATLAVLSAEITPRDAVGRAVTGPLLAVSALPSPPPLPLSTIAPCIPGRPPRPSCANAAIGLTRPARWACRGTVGCPAGCSAVARATCSPAAATVARDLG